MARTATRVRDGGLITGVNVTPFVDIALVLLVIFMVTAAFAAARTQIPMELPRESRSPVTHVQSTARVSVHDGAGLELDGRALTEAQLGRALAELHRANPEVLVVLAADATVAHGRVVSVLDLVRGAGVARFALQTQAPNGDGAAR